ncbi:MAG: hypothetical protein IH900_00810 [Proteobacteria bacterium]|nr:hypothetical protein [Pseudomonadota bacterium]
MTEPDVTLTDYGLVVECAVFAFLLCRKGADDRLLRVWFAVLFGALAVASLAGGTVHGFFLDPATLGHRVLWPASLLAIGVATLAGWSAGARIGFSARVARWISLVAAGGFAGYATVVLFFAQTFRAAMLNYLPAAVFLLAIFLRAYARDKATAPLLGISGLVLTFIAGAIQQLGVSPHPVYFNHNAFYHLIQATALFLLFLAARRFVSPTNDPGRPS